MRNFILTVRPCIDPTLGEYTLEEIVRQVHSYMRLHANRQEMQAKLTGNVQFTKNRFLQMVPLFLKKSNHGIFLPIGWRSPLLWDLHQSWNLSRSPEMEPHIHHMEVMLGQATRPSPHCASISYGNTMAITFAGTGVSSETERRFFLPSGAGRDPCQGGVQPYPLIC